MQYFPQRGRKNNKSFTSLKFAFKTIFVFLDERKTNYEEDYNRYKETLI